MFGYNNIRYLSILDVPDFKDKNIKMDLRNAIKTFILPSTKIIQDSAADDNYLYFLCGQEKDGELWQIDITSHEARVIDLPSYNLNREPEGIDCYEDGFLVSFLGSSSFYKISIKK
jgi:hypothetical protein